MAKVSMLAKLRAHRGKGDKLVAAFGTVFDQVEKEVGTEVYVLNRAADDPDVFWFYELYVDGDALGAHGGSEAVAEAAPLFGPLIAESELIMGTPLRAKGLAI